MTFRNVHLSVSRLKRYEQCPCAFKLHYVDELPSEPGIPGEFGKLLHDTLQQLFQWVVDEEFTGFLPEDRMVALYREAWSRSGLTGLALYQEGLTILRSYVRRHPKVDHFNVLGIEIEFNLQLEEFIVNGRIDRVDRVDDETVRIIDYKSNRMLFHREEVDFDLQMSCYALAARELYPWAKRFEFVFHMLRHDLHMGTTRSDEQIQDAAGYIVALGRETECTQDYPPRLNPNCGYCDHRRQCDAYQEALAKKIEIVAIDKDDLDQVARTRELVSAIAKLSYRRQKELDDILKAHLEQAEGGVLVLAGHIYRILNTTTSEYPVSRTLELVVKFAGISREQAERELATVQKTKLDAFVKELGERSKGKAVLLEAELDALAKKVPFATRLHVSSAKSSPGRRLASAPKPNGATLVRDEEIK